MTRRRWPDLLGLAVLLLAVAVVGAVSLGLALALSLTPRRPAPPRPGFVGPASTVDPTALGPPTLGVTTSGDRRPVPGCPAPSTRVDSAEALETALTKATPGDVIVLAPGTYPGQFVATGSGTSQRPITLCGGADAVLDGGGVKHGYVIHLDHASHWRLIGFSVRNGQKGVVADATVGSVIQGLAVSHIGDEAIHLRRGSTDNLVVGNQVDETGLRRSKFGEGIYVGTARSNWCEISGCSPDHSDRNVIRGNRITRTTAESVDIKEGTTGGQLLDNVFDGAALTAADSWVDVKGNDWLIAGNTGRHSPQDGFQTHEILHGWGDHNEFRNNHAEVDGPGHGFALTPPLGNDVSCDNTSSGAAGGLSNVACR